MAKASQGMDVGKMAAEGFGQMMNSMDFFKRAWSGLATPFTPTVNVEEIDKRITDLRAVEQWLSLNQNLLRSTIQGLEIQRGTLEAINTVTSSFGNALKPSDDSMAQSVARHAAAAAQKSVEPPAPAASEPKTGGLFGPFDWSPFGMPSSLLPGFHTASAARIGSGAEEATSPADAAATAASGSAAGAAPGESAAAMAGPGTEEGAEAGASGAGASGSDAGGTADAGAGSDAGTGGAAKTADASPLPGMNPLAWWQMLQENFRQIAQAATGDATKASPFGLSGVLPGAGAGTPGASGGKAGSPGSKAGGRAGKAAGGAAAPGGAGGGSSRSGAAPRKKKAEAGASRAVGTGSTASGATAAGKRSRRKAGSAKDSG